MATSSKEKKISQGILEQCSGGSRRKRKKKKGSLGDV
jgi:hypothetical protein